jgi:hypothetical protein
MHQHLVSPLRGTGVPVVQVVDYVGGVEELRDGSVDVLLRLLEGVGFIRLFGLVRVVEGLSFTSVRAIVVDIGVLALPVLLSKDLESGETLA